VGEAAEARAGVDPNVEQQVLDVADDWIGPVVVELVELQHADPGGA
jgi:hypothetical protein